MWKKGLKSELHIALIGLKGKIQQEVMQLSTIAIVDSSIILLVGILFHFSLCFHKVFMNKRIVLYCSQFSCINMPQKEDKNNCI